MSVRLGYVFSGSLESNKVFFGHCVPDHAMSQKLSFLGRPVVTVETGIGLLARVDQNMSHHLEVTFKLFKTSVA